MIAESSSRSDTDAVTLARADPTRALSDPTTSYTEVKRLLQKLPDEVPAAVAAEAALRLRDDQAWCAFARSVGKLPERILRVLLERLADEPRSPLSVFLLTAMHDSDELERDWATAMKGVLAGAWGRCRRIGTPGTGWRRWPTTSACTSSASTWFGSPPRGSALEARARRSTCIRGIASRSTGRCRLTQPSPSPVKPSAARPGERSQSGSMRPAPRSAAKPASTVL